MRRIWKVLLVSLMLVGAATGSEALQVKPRPNAATPARLALKGLDPIEFLAGKAVAGKRSITVDYRGHTYVFASEKNRQLFTGDPVRYSIQGDGSCPVVPSAKVDPGIVTLYKGRIYAFATPQCLISFSAQPEKYLSTWPGNPEKKKANR